MDTRSGVDDKDYQPPFLVPLKAAEEKLLQQKAQETKNKLLRR